MCHKEDKILPNPEFATPQKTIMTYWRYLNARDYKNALSCFVDFNETNFDSTSIFKIPPGIESLAVDTFLSCKNFGKKEAILTYRVKFYSQRNQTWKSFTTGDRLILTPGGWKIKDVITHR